MRYFRKTAAVSKKSSIKSDQAVCAKGNALPFSRRLDSPGKVKRRHASVEMFTRGILQWEDNQTQNSTTNAMLSLSRNKMSQIFESRNSEFFLGLKILLKF